MGMVEDKRTTHYRVFIPCADSRLGTQYPQCRIYVGTRGALRFSRSGKVTETGMCGDKYRDMVLSRAG